MATNLNTAIGHGSPSSASTSSPESTQQSSASNLADLKHQLNIARSEIANLRQQLRNLTHVHQKEVTTIQNALISWKCNDCDEKKQKPGSNNELSSSSSSAVTNGEDGSTVAPLSLRPIGTVTTWFPQKKGTPRQPGICVGSRGKLTLSNGVFTNPEHALEGLDGFSHMWILFYFHKNDSTHVRAKVSPPRLNGARTGVFGTRSPHRPSPLGLSLVSIDRVEGCSVYFSGVDMLDGTPVLDIKPYIPQYDNPVHCESPTEWLTASASSNLSNSVSSPSSPSARHLDGREGSMPALLSSSSMGEREAPDGEEGATCRTVLAPPLLNSTRSLSPAPQVRVPAWITDPPVSQLNVVYSERARAQLAEIASSPTESGDESVETLIAAISGVLREDPRSVYLRDKWGNQFYTFLIRELHVSCKFNDASHEVSVFQVRPAGRPCACGLPSWQCTQYPEGHE